MSRVSQLAKHAFDTLNQEKPRSSVTEWVDILTSQNYADEVYDGIPELIESIDLQPTGIAEASRAIRKKIKHGSAHQQYRAMVVTTFADSMLTDAIKHLATDPGTDSKVKRKTIAVLASWHRQFADDRSMAAVAGLYRQVKPAEPPRRPQVDRTTLEEEERRHRDEEAARKASKEEAKLKAKRAKEQAKAEGEARRRKAKEKPTARSQRKPFNFEEEKPKVLEAIATASSAANNLVNAITLVNTEHDSLLTNARVQECLERVKQVRKPIVRYIQLVENEEFIGTLIETNERIIAALETYDKLSNPEVTEQDVESVQQGLAAVKIGDSEVSKLQEKQRAAVRRAAGRREPRLIDGDDAAYTGQVSSHMHPDLQDLSFGELGAEQRLNRHGSLSDYSDYESSNEETHNARSGPSTVQRSARVQAVEDPFADPFAD
ncbi:hypothetical protein K488DRAFT_77420 [Vararia minispora EC-137]|uniref:Uncharacterized protein n=1 Tax=Vararia minispora EC-137 TaxID=1314806 RepID=A0ACB8QRH4_9AGAM|nr:hypothetical protein K488DRAFT_77420 [Vararia minispora EC-137]